MRFGSAKVAAPAPRFGGGFVPSAADSLPSMPSAPKPAADRPFENLGKATVSILGGPVAGGSPETTAVMPTPFEGVPILGNLAEGLGAVGEVGGDIVEGILPGGGFRQLQKKQIWDQSADDPIRQQFEQMVKTNAMSQSMAKAQFYRYMLDKSGANPLAVQAQESGLGGVGGALLTQLGALDYGRALVARLVSGTGSRLEDLQAATDEQLENNPELIDIRDRFAAGELTRDRALDELGVAGFQVTDPLKSDVPFAAGLGHLGIDLLTDPLNLISLGGAGLVRQTGRATTRGAVRLAREVGEETLKDFTKRVAAKGLATTDDVIIKEALDDPTMSLALERAMSGASKMDSYLVLNGRRVRALGIKMRDFLDPFTMFGRDDVGVLTAQQFATKAGSGAIDGFGAGVIRSTRAKAASILGAESADLLDDAFDRAAAQVVVQVGNEQVIRHARLTQSLDGVGVDPTLSAYGSAKNLGGDISGRVQDRVERVAYRLVPREAGPAGVRKMLAEARERGVQQVMSVTGGRVDEAAARQFVSQLNERELSVLDFQHYGSTVKEFIAARGQSIATNRAAPTTQMPLDRLTFVAPRQLRKLDLDRLRSAVTKKNWDVVRNIITQFDDLYRIYDLGLADDELGRVLGQTLTQLESTIPKTITDISKLPPEMQAFMAKYGPMGYSLALRPSDQTLARPLVDKAGNIVGVNPWVDVVDEKTAAPSINRLKVIQRGLFSNISGSSVHREARQRFVRLGAEQAGLPEQPLERIFDAVAKAAQDRSITPRGLYTHEMYQAALTVKLPRSLRGRLNERQLAFMVLKAHEGSLGRVGLTQKFTGAVKTAAFRATGSTGVALLAERLYPMARFRLNPFFQTQEGIETPFFLLLRGQLPMRDFKRAFTAKGRAEVMQEVEDSLWARGLIDRKGQFVASDSAEQSAMYTAGSMAVGDELGRMGLLQRARGLVPNIRAIKEWGEVRSWETNQASGIAAAMKRASPESWRTYSEWAMARTRAETDGRAVTQFAMDTVMRANPDSAYAQFGPHAFRPDHMGERAKVSLRLVKSLVLGEEGEKLKTSNFMARIRDPKDGLDVSDIEEALNFVGADPAYIERTIALVTTPVPDEFWAGFVKLGRTVEEVEAWRATTQAMAAARGISEHEYLSRQFANGPMALNHLGEVQGRKMFQAIADAFEARGVVVVPRDSPLLGELATRGSNYLPNYAGPPEPWRASPNAPFVEYVTVKELKKQGYQGNELGKTELQQLADDISANGFNEPLMLTYRTGDRKAVLDEGNHRLAAAELAGIERVPVWVRRLDGEGGRVGRKVPGIDVDEFGYTPASLKPSEIGLRTFDEPTTAKALNKAQQDARLWRIAREKRAADPKLGMPPELDARGVTPEQGRAIQAAYDAGDVPPSGPDLATVRRGDKLIHRVGEVQGDEWWSMLRGVMDEDTLREKADWYIDMRRAFLALSKNDPEEATRLTVLFGLSQLNTSPVDGMRFVSRVLAAARRGEELPVDQKFGGLNAGALKRAIEDGELGGAEGLGQKLLDFVDSLIGNRARTSGISGPDPANPWMPAAADIWAKRDLGFLDDKMALHLKTVYGADSVTWDPKVGFAIVIDGQTSIIPKEKVTGGAPDDLEYDHIVEFYNDRAREANARGFLERNDWSAAEMQALGWFRAKFAMGDNTGSPLDAFFKSTHSVHWEALPAPESELAEVFPGLTHGPDFSAVADEIGVPTAREVAADYITAMGQPLPGRRSFKASPEFGLRTARAYDSLPGPTKPVVSTGPVTSDSLAAPTRKLRTDHKVDAATRKSYQAFVDETMRQADTIRARGVRFEPVLDDPYENSAAMMADVRDNGRLKVFAGSAEHPLLTDDQNVLFRAVHDYFAHAAEGNQFGPRGELNAAIKHSQMYSPDARKAMLTETHGQNSFVNFSDKAMGDDTVANINKAKPGSIYAEQKAALLPDDILDEFERNYIAEPDGIARETLTHITKDIADELVDEAERVLGVTVVARYDGVGVWTQGETPNMTFEVMGTKEDAQAFAAYIGAWAEQGGVPISRPINATVARPADGQLHAVDWAPVGEGKATYAQAEKALRKLMRDSPLAAKGASIVRYDDGSYGVRAIWLDFDPAWYGKKKMKNQQKGRGASKRIEQVEVGEALTMAEFRAAHPDADLLDPFSFDGVEFVPERRVVESSYHGNDWATSPKGESYIQQLRDLEAKTGRAGYGKAADELVGPARGRARAAYERAFQRHDRRALALFRAERAATDDGWALRAASILHPDRDPADAVGLVRADIERWRSIPAGRPAGGGTGSGAIEPAAFSGGDALFQRHPRGTLGAISFDAADGRARVYLNKKGQKPDTLLHEMSHRFAEQDLDPSGRAMVLDLFNSIERGTKKRRPRGATKLPPETQWTEEVHEWFAEQMVRWVRTGEAPAAEMEPIFGFYAKHLGTIAKGKEVAPEVKSFLDEVAARVPERAHAFSTDEQALMDLMLTNADRAARNARDLIHFRTNRTWLERSLNHPYFGMYPLSYMWGKVLPELVEFLAFRPFGLHAPGVALRTVSDVYNAVLLQQEYDPELRKYMTDNEPAMRTLAMLVPGVPWDLPVNSPLWLRRVAEAVATQQQRVNEGKRNPDGTPAQLDLTKVDIGRIATDTAGYALNPVRGFENISDIGATAGALGGLVTGTSPDRRTTEPARLTTENPAQQPTPQPVAPTRPESSVSGSQPTPADELADELAQAAEELAVELAEQPPTFGE